MLDSNYQQAKGKKMFTVVTDAGSVHKMDADGVQRFMDSGVSMFVHERGQHYCPVCREWVADDYGLPACDCSVPCPCGCE